MNCTLCNSTLVRMADVYYFICDNCGAYVKDIKYNISNQQELERYKEHNNDVNNSGYQAFTAPITNSILAHQTKEQLGLDYGCGPGPVISKQLTDSGYQIKLYDPFFYPNEEYKNHTYDYIFSCEVFEHFHQPKQEIENILNLLNPNATLYIMTHLYQTDIDFMKWHYRNDPTHVFIYTHKTIEYIAKVFHLKIEKINDRLIIVKKQ